MLTHHACVHTYDDARAICASADIFFFQPNYFAKLCFSGKSLKLGETALCSAWLAHPVCAAMPDYLSDPRVAKLGFMRLKKFLIQKNADEDKLFGAGTKFSLIVPFLFVLGLF